MNLYSRTGLKSATLALVLAAAFADLSAPLAQNAASADPPVGANRNAYVGSAVCATCHSEISRSYAQTAMALTSGPADAVHARGAFHHDPSNVDYRVYEENGRVFFSYERPGEPTTHGRQGLDYYVGSGRRGRSYLFSIDGFVFQAPVSYYSQADRWDVSPDYGSSREIPLNRAIEPSCLYCHASRMRPVAGTENRYASPAFAENGVGCERCHGPGGEHVAGRAAMVNPATLAPERRDSVCAQCHLTGEAGIERQGMRLDDFRPGDLLSDYVSYFVYDTKDGHSLRATSHVQALAQSVCKLRSGDRMSCTTCHDPHANPAPRERAAYFRARCLACHEQQNPSESDRRHFAGGADCVSCHMPKAESLDVDHTAVTDHRIPRRPSNRPAQWPEQQRLKQLGGAGGDGRELGLAYAELALRVHDPFPGSEAFRLLKQVLPLYPKDAAVATALAYLYQQRGDLDRAAELYATALREEPSRVVAAVNLGVIDARRGRMRDAEALWEGALARNPGLSEAGVNLAVALCSTGDVDRARTTLLEVLVFNPDFGSAKRLLREIDAGRAPGGRPAKPDGRTR